MKNFPCPCQSHSDYHACCGLLHQGGQTATSAEQLMRSRYSAYVLKNISYLQATLHPSHQQPDDAFNLQQTMATTQWLGLSIIDHVEKGDQAEVEFVAFYSDHPIGQLHERSRFSRQQGQWFYMEGDFLPPIKLGRNDSCICGSGKKLKRCHG
ncbi:YchJ family protein [Methylophaga pinxianii]|uniref:YchJ family protein n=1 Tax=Methylophaga pinxianii TaxID=2881052 RepID=UPI001CF18C90|nr:YchJ family protein [Methylophaga pinxianii]MCB2426852.1 YchJ family protein [Methylophaga pinxianii]UPH47034.1 YchJ family protein [Methylophaga pinxianii]